MSNTRPKWDHYWKSKWVQVLLQGLHQLLCYVLFLLSAETPENRDDIFQGEEKIYSLVQMVAVFASIGWTSLEPRQNTSLSQHWTKAWLLSYHVGKCIIWCCFIGSHSMYGPPPPPHLTMIAYKPDGQLYLPPLSSSPLPLFPLPPIPPPTSPCPSDGVTSHTTTVLNTATKLFSLATKTSMAVA